DQNKDEDQGGPVQQSLTRILRTERPQIERALPHHQRDRKNEQDYRQSVYDALSHWGPTSLIIRGFGLLTGTLASSLHLNFRRIGPIKGLERTLSEVRQLCVTDSASPDGWR